VIDVEFTNIEDDSGQRTLDVDPDTGEVVQQAHEPTTDSLDGTLPGF
jgi:hypothetical protein